MVGWVETDEAEVEVVARRCHPALGSGFELGLEQGRSSTGQYYPVGYPLRLRFQQHPPQKYPVHRYE